ncbi:hypothetical protein JXI42_13865 [bacterium]|nr:hypothetical protein [bacterium]
MFKENPIIRIIKEETDASSIRNIICISVLLFTAHLLWGVEGNNPEPSFQEPKFVPKETRITTPLDLLPFFEEPFEKYIAGYYEPTIYKAGLLLGNEFKYGLKFHHAHRKRALDVNFAKYVDFLPYYKARGEGYYLTNFQNNYSLAFYGKGVFDKLDKAVSFRDSKVQPECWDFSAGMNVLFMRDNIFITGNVGGEGGAFTTDKYFPFQRAFGESEILWVFSDNIGVNLLFNAEMLENGLGNDEYSDFIRISVKPYIYFGSDKIQMRFGAKGVISENDTIIQPYLESWYNTYPIRFYIKYDPDIYLPNYYSISGSENLTDFPKNLKEAKDILKLNSGVKFYFNDNNNITFSALVQKTADDFITSFNEEQNYLMLSNYNKKMNGYSTTDNDPYTTRYDLHISGVNQIGNLVNKFLVKINVDKTSGLISPEGYYIVGPYETKNELHEVNDYYIPFTPKVSFTDTISYSVKDNLILTANLHWSGNRRANWLYGEEPLSSYKTIGAGVSYTYKDLTFSVFVDNILNQKYEYYPGYYDSGSRGFAGVEYRF